MRAIGNRPLEEINLKRVLVLFLFASLLRPQFNIDQITHPLSPGYKTLIDSTESHLLLEAINHVDIEDMIYKFNNSFEYKTKINGYVLNLSYSNNQSEINSDTTSTLFKFILKQKYHSYKININKRFYKWTGGLGYDIIYSQEPHNNYNFFINRKINNYLILEFRYALNTVPTYLGLEYEDFKYWTLNNQNAKTSSILYSFRNSMLENNFKYERISYNNLSNPEFDLTQRGKHSTYIDLLVNLNKKFDFYINWDNSLDTMIIDLLKNESIFYKINILKAKQNSYLVKMNYKLRQSVFTLGFNQASYQYELSSRVNIQDISDNLVVIFTVPIINGLDTIKIIQDNIFFLYHKKMMNSKYNIGINFSKNNIHYYHRAGTPPLNPLIPIFKTQRGDYTLNIVNLIIGYSYLFNKFNFNITIDNMTPIKSINNTENNQGSKVDEISSEDKLKMFTKLYFTVTYKIR